MIAGTHGRTGLTHVLLGSVASRILTEVPSDIMVVPSRPSLIAGKGSLSGGSFTSA